MKTEDLIISSKKKAGYKFEKNKLYENKSGINLMVTLRGRPRELVFLLCMSFAAC